MKSKMWKVIAALMAAAMIACVGAGCSGNENGQESSEESDASSDEGSTDYSGYSAFFGSWEHAVADEYYAFELYDDGTGKYRYKKGSDVDLRWSVEEGKLCLRALGGLETFEYVDGKLKDTENPREYIKVDSFDVVISGNVIGNNFDEQISEVTRVTKNGGWLVLCNGDDSYKHLAPGEKFISNGFEWFRHESRTGGIIYDYRKQIFKE